MLNPVVTLPFPAALAMLVLLAYVLRAAQRPDLHIPPRTEPREPRHRLAATSEPYRPRAWDAVTADGLTVPVIPGPEEPATKTVAYGLLDAEVPLTEVQEYLRLIGCADWTAPLTEFERRAGVVELEPAL